MFHVLGRARDCGSTLTVLSLLAATVAGERCRQVTIMVGGYESRSICPSNLAESLATSRTKVWMSSC